MFAKHAVEFIILCEGALRVLISAWGLFLYNETAENPI